MLERWLSSDERGCFDSFARFAASDVVPFADDWDRRNAVAPSVVEALAQRGWLGCLAAKESGGLGHGPVTFGLLNLAIGTGSASLTGLLNVHAMVLKTVERWGTADQKARYLRSLANGSIIGAFAQTERSAGGDTGNLSTRFEIEGDELVIDGRKTWITFAQRADLFLVFGKLSGLDAAALVPRGTAGLEIEPQNGMLGFRSAGLAALSFRRCRVPAANLVGRPGFGQSLISSAGLNYGRLSVAWAAVGLQRAALSAAADWANRRSTFGTLLVDQGIVRAYLAEMSCALRASQLVCLSASRAFEADDEDAVTQILEAKLFASEEAARAAARAVQIHGGHGCEEDNGVSRLYRDAKILQIVEGSNELQKMLIGKDVGRRQLMNSLAAEERVADVLACA